MKRLFRRMAVGFVLAATLFALEACPPPQDNGVDSLAPMFTGLQIATANGLTQADLSWIAATDDRTSASDIVYEIWMANVSSVPTTAAPAFTTSPGATGFTVTGLPGFQTTYFLVRAKDAAGNVDDNTDILGVTPTSATWDLVDGGQANGISDGSAVYVTSAAVVADKLYVMWLQRNAGNSTYYARVSAYNGNDSAPSWTSIDGGASAGINHDASKNVYITYTAANSLAAFNNRLYATWSESYGAGQEVRVAMYDPAGSGWTFVDGNGTNGLNHDATRTAFEPSLVVSGSTMYVVWLEQDASLIQQVRASSYNGNDSSPVWTSIDGGGAGGINYSTSVTANTLAAASYNGRLIAAWDENVQIRVKAFDGSGWSQADQGVLNYNPSRNAIRPFLASAGGTLYLSWDEYNSTTLTTLIRARAFNGNFASPSWSFIDGGGDAGLNIDPTYQARLSTLVELNGGLVVAFTQNNGSPYQLRARVFNGDVNSPVWQTIDGGSSNGLNHDPLYDADQQFAVSLAGKVYITWVEQSGTTHNQTRVIRGM